MVHAFCFEGLFEGVAGIRELRVYAVDLTGSLEEL